MVSSPQYLLDGLCHCSCAACLCWRFANTFYDKEVALQAGVCLAAALVVAIQVQRSSAPPSALPGQIDLRLLHCRANTAWVVGLAP